MKLLKILLNCKQNFLAVKVFSLNFSSLLSRLVEKRDKNYEIPANSIEYFNMWSLESITYISLDRRLELFDPNSREENGKKLLKVGEAIFKEN